MIPQVVVDIGNTRIKWGQVADDGRSIARFARLPEDSSTWEKEVESWGLACGGTWVLASVRPQRAEKLTSWLEARGDRVIRLGKSSQLPLTVALEQPERAGIDRLLNGVAAKRHLLQGQPAVLIDAGSAVTVDWLDEEHAFRGGSIFPGLDLMAEALHNYTALLPRVEVTLPLPALPAGNTITAMQIGLFLAVSGGIREAVRGYAEQSVRSPRVFFSGGQAPLLARGMGLLDGTRPLPAPWGDFLLWPEQTLIGILDSVEALS